MVELRRESVFSASSKGLSVKLKFVWKFNININQFLFSRQKVLKHTSSNKNAAVSYYKLYKFATKFQLLLVFIGIICSILSSLGIPFIIVLYGEFTTILIDRVREVETSTHTLVLSWFGGGRIL